MAEREEARRIDPPAKPSNKARLDVPSGEELLEEWSHGQMDDPPLTYQMLGEKYGCSSSLIHRRISRVDKEKIISKVKTPLDMEMKMTRNLIEGFSQLKENCGEDAVRRAIKYIQMHMGIDIG